MTLSILLAVAAELILGVFSLDILPSIVVTILLLALSFLAAVRSDLGSAKPPIWGRLELRSDLTLDQVHRIIQVSFDWLDTHLQRFAPGGSPLDRGAQLSLCPFDVAALRPAGVSVRML